MRRLREGMLRLGGLFQKQCKDRELDAEIESHLQMHIEDNLRLGMTPEEARRHALIKLGGVESTKEAYRDQRGLPWLEILWQDVRYGVRDSGKFTLTCRGAPETPAGDGPGLWRQLEGGVWHGGMDRGAGPEASGTPGGARDRVDELHWERGWIPDGDLSD